MKNNFKKDTSNNEEFHFGKGRSDELFLKLLKSTKLWEIPHQKQFQKQTINEEQFLD